MFGLVGRNGAGKSTLMRTVATLQDPDSGSIDLDGIDVLRQKDEVRRILGSQFRLQRMHITTSAALCLASS